MTAKDSSWLDLYQTLLDAWGPQHWWPADSPFEVMVGAILTQNTAWSNVEKAIGRLRQAQALTVSAVLKARDAELEEWLRPAGYFRVKAKRLRAFCQFLEEQGVAEQPQLLGLDLETLSLRALLLGVHGVGEETADSILLYALGRSIMVVDAYTRRIGSRLGWVGASIGYKDLQGVIEASLPKKSGVPLRKEFHALLVSLGKEHCRPRNPRCHRCPVQAFCRYGQGVSDQGRVRAD